MSGKVLECHNLQLRRGSKPLDGTTVEESIVSFHLKRLSKKIDTLEGYLAGCPRRSKRSKLIKSIRPIKGIRRLRA